MKKHRATCFISYNDDDVDKKSLTYLKDWIKRESENKISVLFDEDLNPGKSFKDFMEKLNEVDAAIVIMTPGYKRKVETRTGGVYEEYKIIYERYTKGEEDIKKVGEELKGNNNFSLIPILFSGSPEASVLNELKHIKYSNFINFRASINTKDELYITDHTEKEYKNEIKKIVNEINTTSSFNSPYYKEYYKYLFKQLFIDLKADWQSHLEKKLFVKTKAYKKIEDQVGYFLIGRKGSGKSTVTTFIANQNKDEYKGVIPIIVDKINLENLFAYYEIQRVESDTKNIVSKHITFLYTWELFFYVCCMEIILQESKKGTLTTYQESKVEPIRNFISEIKNQTTTEDNDQVIITETYYTFCLDAVLNFLDKCIKGAVPDPVRFRFDIINKFTFGNLLNQVFGKEVIRCFRDIIDSCKRRILITLDGFDTAFDEYRRNSIINYGNDSTLLEKRTILEIEWLRALLKLVLTVKHGNKHSNKLYELIDFCITIPRDRFIEVKQTERDSYIYQKRYIELNWSGIELAILLRKRLEALSGFECPKMKPEQKLSYVIKEKFENIPVDININLDGKSYISPIFLYVLRFSFWRLSSFSFIPHPSFRFIPHFLWVKL